MEIARSNLFNEIQVGGGILKILVDILIHIYYHELISISILEI